MPTAPVTLNEEQVAFYHEVGRAVTAWAHVEIALCFVFRACFGEDQFRTAGNSFFAVENFRSKLALVDAALNAAFPDDPRIPDWQRHAARAQGQAAVRNRIAHGIVMIYQDEKPGRRLAITAWGAPFPKRGNLPMGALCVKDVYLAARQFDQLGNQMLNLAARLADRPEPYGAEFLPPLQAPQLPQLMRRIRTMLSPPREPSRE